MTLNGNQVSPQCVNNQVIILEEDGKYDLELVMDLPNNIDETIEDTENIDNTEYMKYIKKVNLKERIIKDSNSKLFHFDRELVDNSVIDQIEIIKDKDDIELKIFKSGFEIPYNSILSQPGWYRVLATDKFGNKQEVKFRIKIRKLQVVGYIMLIIMLVIIFIYIRKKIARNYESF